MYPLTHYSISVFFISLLLFVKLVFCFFLCSNYNNNNYQQNQQNVQGQQLVHETICPAVSNNNRCSYLVGDAHITLPSYNADSKYSLPVIYVYKVFKYQADSQPLWTNYRVNCLVTFEICNVINCFSSQWSCFCDLKLKSMLQSQCCRNSYTGNWLFNLLYM
mgnify:CR=1 FL=1